MTLSLLISWGAGYSKNVIIEYLTHNLGTEANAIKKLLNVTHKKTTKKLTNLSILSSEPGGR